MTQNPTVAQSFFEAQLNEFRRRCQDVERSVRSITAEVADLPEGTEFQEVNAQLMLAVRHLEDARMRMGKAIQWGCNGGTSCYDGGKG